MEGLRKGLRNQGAGIPKFEQVVQYDVGGTKKSAILRGNELGQLQDTGRYVRPPGLPGQL